MNLSLKLLVFLPFGFAAVALACSSEEPSSKSSINAASPDDDDDKIVDQGDDDDVAQGDDDDDDKPAKKDAGTPTKDAGKDSGGQQGAFTKADVQKLFNSRCTPCHIGNASGGMSLANDFTTQTVGIDSTELPSMKRIEAGDKEASYLFHKLSGTHLDQGGSGVRMPKGGPYLSSAEIADIGAYIDSL